MRKLYYIIVILSLSIIACDENNILLEIIGTDQTITVTSPPDEVFEIAMKPYRDLQFSSWIRLYHSDDETLIAHELEKKQLILKELDGVAIEDYGPILLDRQKAFYTKYIDAEGIAIIADAAVKDIDVIWARHVVLTMTAKRPELREFFQMEDGFYLVLLGSRTPAEDMPLILGDYNAFRQNTCSLHGGRMGTCWAQITLQDDTASRLSQFTHEFAHALERIIEHLEPGFFDKQKFAYEQAKERWKEQGAKTRALAHAYLKNEREYWAYGTEDWFYYINHPNIPFISWHETYEEFAEKDPLLYELYDEWFPKRTLLIPLDPNDPGDVNGDGHISILDFLLVRDKLGQRCQCPEDVNGDGIVDINDYGYIATHPYYIHIDGEVEKYTTQE